MEDIVEGQSSKRKRPSLFGVIFCCTNNQNIDPPVKRTEETEVKRLPNKSILSQKESMLEAKAEKQGRYEVPREQTIKKMPEQAPILFNSDSLLESSESVTICESSSEDVEESLNELLDAVQDWHLPHDLLLPKGPLQIFSLQLQMGPIGNVKIGSFRSKFRVAVKSINNTSNTLNCKRKSVESELQLLKYLGTCPNLLTCYGYIINGPSLQIVYELAPYGTLDKILLENKILSFPLQLIVAWLSDLADAMHFLHSKGIIHGGIKAENILVFERLEIKLCNFQSSVSVVPDQPLFKTFSFSSFSDEKLQKIIRSFAWDMEGFLSTALQILTRRSAVEIQHMMMVADLEKEVAQVMVHFPVSEYNLSSAFYDFMLSIVKADKRKASRTSKDISEELFHMLDETCDGDPRESTNSHGMKVKQVEMLIMSCTPNIQEIIQISNLIENGGRPVTGVNGNTVALQLILQRLKSRNNHQAHHSLSSSGSSTDRGRNGSSFISLPETEIIIDQRQALKEWLENTCEAPSGIAESLACTFIQLRLFTVAMLKEKVISSPSFLKKIHVGDRFLKRKIYEKLREGGN